MMQRKRGSGRVHRECVRKEHFSMQKCLYQALCPVLYPHELTDPPGPPCENGLLAPFYRWRNWEQTDDLLRVTQYFLAASERILESDDTGNQTLNQWFSKDSSSNNSITWEFIINLNSQAPPWLPTTGDRSLQTVVNKPPKRMRLLFKGEVQCCKPLCSTVPLPDSFIIYIPLHAQICR